MGLVSIKRNVGVEQLSWSGDSSATTSIGKLFHLLQVTVVFRVTATGVKATITNDCMVSVDSAYHANYDTILGTVDNVAGKTDNYFTFEESAVFPHDYEIKVECNVGAANTAYAEVYYEPVG